MEPVTTDRKQVFLMEQQHVPLSLQYTVANQTANMVALVMVIVMMLAILTRLT
jgi:hypothetical protein